MKTSINEIQSSLQLKTVHTWKVFHLLKMLGIWETLVKSDAKVNEKNLSLWPNHGISWSIYHVCPWPAVSRDPYRQEKLCSKTSGVQKAPKQGHKHWQRQDRESNHGQNASKGKTNIAMQLFCLKVFATSLKGSCLILLLNRFKCNLT